MIPVIICGGFGTKLWPVSRQSRPKHFLPLLNGKSLFRLNYEALLMGYKPEEIYISTNTDQLNLAKQQASEIPDGNFILEPEMRNQGPASGLIAAFLYKKGLQDEPFMIIQSDDLREPAEEFIKMMKACDSLARRENKYITGGFRPDYPMMGVDYLVKGDLISRDYDVGVYKVSQFIWRSTKEQTEELLKQDNALVHTNHTCMTSKNFLNMLSKYKPEWYTPLMNIVNGADIATEYAKMPPGPLEDVTQKVHADGESVIVELPFKWFDIGTYESLDKYLRANNLYSENNSVVNIQSSGNYVRVDDADKIVALVGVSDMVVVDTGDALLICPKKQSGLVGDALKEVKARKLSLT